MPFRYVDPEVTVPYRELPRITRVKIQKRQVKIWFSLPMDAFSLKAIRKTLLYADMHYPLSYSKLSEDGYCLTLNGDTQSLGDQGDTRDMQLLFSGWPMDLEGKKLNSWASDIPVSLYPLVP